MPRSVLIFGNPGTGKSTILNLLCGSARFTSGYSEGSGVTQEMSRVEHDGVVYFDVPGLSDVRLRDKAAQSITQALRQAGRDCTVFFTATLQSGRVLPDEAATIRTVLLAAPDIRSSYGVIFNKLSPRELRSVQTNRQAFIDNIMEIVPPTRRTTQFHFQGKVACLDDAESIDVDFATLAANTLQELCGFVRTSVAACTIDPNAVSPVDPATFAQVLNNYEALQREVAEQAEQLRRAEEALAEEAARAAAAERGRRAAEEDRAREAARAAEAEGGRREAEAQRAQEAARAQEAETMRREAEMRRAQEAARAQEAERARRAAEEARAREADRAAAAKAEQEKAEARAREAEREAAEAREAQQAAANAGEASRDREVIGLVKELADQRVAEARRNEERAAKNEKALAEGLQSGVGAGVAIGAVATVLAPFTGGTSLLVGSLIGAAVGTATGAVVNQANRA